MEHEIEARRKETLDRESTRAGLVFRPDVDIVERENEFLVLADLPGADEEHVQVRLEEGVLRIDASLAVVPGEDWQLVHGEYRLGQYHREFRLSEHIDVERIRASMRDGVLELHLPKADRHRPRVIAVRGG
jgi:HSP20 family molecular chaperone IbpA